MNANQIFDALNLASQMTKDIYVGNTNFVELSTYVRNKLPWAESSIVEMFRDIMCPHLHEQFEKGHYAVSLHVGGRIVFTKKGFDGVFAAEEFIAEMNNNGHHEGSWHVDYVD